MPQYDDARFSPAAPVAKVILRVPNSDAPPAEALMLIDSGADVTLLPQAAVSFLGIEGDTGEVYHLTGFDGSKSLSRAVRVNLILGQKTLRGRYLVIDQEWGILGRDILNFLRLTLDGPNQSWEER